MSSEAKGAVLTATSVSEIFRAEVESACRNQHADATLEAQTYLTALLGDFVHPEAHAALDVTLDRPISFVLDEALSLPPRERFERLRTLGDGTLYVAGFFGDHLDARGVDGGLFSSVGGFAYGSAAAMLRSASGAGGAVVDVLSELARKFAVFVGILAEVADTTTFRVRDDAGALRLYEKWRRTGSERLARELAACGLSPVLKAGVA